MLCQQSLNWFMKNSSNKITVSIGIPAYNEESNIGYLIVDLLSQNQISYKLDKIIISSDGSTDNTAGVVKSINSPNVLLINNKENKGISARQNQICRKSNSDVLILLDADIVIKDKHFIKKLIKPIAENRADLTSPKLIELNAVTFMEEVILTSMNLKNYVYENFKSGNNVYTCHGPARAFSKKLYKNIRFKTSVGEDAYSYLYCIANKLKFAYVRNTAVYYKLPTNFKDHKKQSIRFFQSQLAMAREFGTMFVLSEYKQPINLVILAVLKSFLVKPIHTGVYSFIVMSMIFQSLIVKKSLTHWDMSSSSKLLRGAR